MKVYIIDSENDDESAWGPYTDKPLVDLTLKIVQMTIDEGAEIKERELNPWPQIKAGLKPWKIWAVLDPASQMPTGNHVELRWPPEDSEGLIERRDDYIEFFVWARTNGEAVLRMAELSRKAKEEMQALPEEEILI